MHKFTAIAIISVISLFATFMSACSSVAKTQTAGNSNSAVAGNSAAKENEPVTIDSHRTFRVDYQSEPNTVQAGTPTTLIFSVKDKQGSVVDDLQIVHEKPMHLLIVSKDLAEFYHVHPERSADGSYKVTHTFPNGGDYKMYADFTPKGAVQVVEQIDLKAEGPGRAKIPLVPDTRFEKTVDGLKIVMKPSAEIKAGEELTLDFQAFDAASGKPATDLQNYLGELAHFVLISEDLTDFVHAHPMAKGESMNMGSAKPEQHGADGHEHSATDGQAKTVGRSEVSAHTAFPRAGLYKLWAQFQRGGKVISVPFIVNVPAGAETAKAGNVPDGAIKVTVSAGGYQPSSIPVQKGRPVLLAFQRLDANNCGGEVVFSKQNIRKKLPVGETVLVEFTATEAGEIDFACGMDMMRGKVVVSEN